MWNRLLKVAVILIAGAGSFTCVGCGGCNDTHSEARGPNEPGNQRQGMLTVRQLAQIVDLSKLPALEGTKFSTRTASRVECVAPKDLKISKVAEFYLGKLAELGWRPTKEAGTKIVSDNFAQAILAKRGDSVAMLIVPGGEGPLVTLLNHGDFDAQTLPRGKHAKLLYGGRTTCSYLTPVAVSDEAADVAKLLTLAGWQQFVPLHAEVAQSDRQQILAFRQKAYLLDVLVNEAPAHAGQTAVQYNVTTLSHDLPAPADAKDVEFDDHRGELKCRASDGMDSVVRFYREAMPAAGFSETPTQPPTPERTVLRFVTPEDDVVMVTLTADGEDATKIEAFGIAAATMAEIRQAEAQRRESAQGEKSTTSEKPPGDDSAEPSLAESPDSQPASDGAADDNR